MLLVVVVGVGWRCTPPGHEPCHLLFHLGEHSVHDGSTAVTAHGRRRGDRANWHGGIVWGREGSFKGFKSDFIVLRGRGFLS